MNTAGSSKSLRPKQAADLLGIGRTTLWKLASTRPDFPRPSRLTPRVTVYDRNSLIAWRNAQADTAPK
jgi:prophage regulatory protein